MSEQLAGLEKTLDEVFVKKAPFQLPENSKKWIVEYSPIIGAVIGVLGLLSAWGLWGAAHVVNRLVDYSNAISSAYGVHETVQHLTFSFYIAFIALLAMSLVHIAAYPGLKARSKAKGWNLLFYGAIISLVYDVFNAVYYGSIFNIIGSLIGSAIGLYILFQIRSYYTGKVSVEKKPEAKK